MAKVNTKEVAQNSSTHEVVTYEVYAMNGKERNLTFYNQALIEHTKRIQGFRDAGNMAVLAIAHELDAMDRDESYKSAGFKSVAEFGQVVFDYKPATVSLYIRSARAFLTGDGEKSLDFVKGIPHLTVGQMIELLPLVKNETDISAVTKALADGEVNQRMSTKDIRKAVQGIRAIPGKATDKGTVEKSDLAKAEKLGEYNSEKLPKGVTPENYAATNLDASVQAFERFVKAMGDIEHDETVDAKVKSVMTMFTELRATLTK